MNLVTNEPGRIVISLSRYNLQTLLRDLDDEVGNPHLRRRVRRAPDGLLLVVKAEPNDVHYASEDRQTYVRIPPSTPDIPKEGT